MKLNFFFSSPFGGWGAIFLFLILVSCKKNAVPTVIKEGLPNEYLDARASVEFRSVENDANFKMKIRHQRDKRTWAMFTKLGIEGMRVIARPDSVFTLNYLKDEYQASSIDALAEMINFPIEYNMLQSLILGDMPNSDTTGAKYEGDFIKISQQMKHISIENKLFAQNKKLAELYLVDNRNQNRMLIQYADYRPSPQLLFPFKINISVDFVNKQTNKREKTTMKLDFSNARFTSMPLEFPFVVPKSFLKKKK